MHDAIVDSLEKRLRGPDRQVWKEHEYRNNGDHEADLLMINFKKKYAYAIEVKTTNHYKARKKARKQLDADVTYLNRRWNINKIYKFYAYSAKRKEQRAGKLYEIKLW